MSNGEDYENDETMKNINVWFLCLLLLQTSTHNENFSNGKEFYLQGLNRFSTRTVQELRSMLTREVRLSSITRGEDCK